VLSHVRTGDPAPKNEEKDRHGNRYRLVAVYPAAELSGWGLALYHREPVFRWDR
jgi:hypothetical protein